MIGATFCSGIGAPEVAAPWVDWQLASEIETFPREVLAHRFGHRDARHHRTGPRLWGDFTALRPRHLRRLNIPLPDIIVAGTPCQSFSIAGLRRGAADDRGNLTLQFVRTAHAIVNARSDGRSDGRLVVLWENVPGVLSDKGNAFGAFLGGMVGAVDALPSPENGSWPGEGMVQGPRARAAWAVLDAQWFGVAQRRRRVFVVFDFGNACDPAAVLFDRDSLRGNTPPRRKAGKDIAPTISARPTGGGGLGTDFDCDGGLIQVDNWPAETAPTLNAHFGDKMGLENQHALNGAGLFVPVAHTLRGDGFDASEDGTGRGTPLVPVAFDCKGTEVQYSTDGSHPTLRSMGHMHSHQNAGGHAAVALPWAVRRLTATECERLQGFPDGHTLIPRQRRRVLKSMDDELQYLRATHPDMTPEDAVMLAADGPRYKALGNSMAVPLVRWIMDRIRESTASLTPPNQNRKDQPRDDQDETATRPNHSRSA